MYAFCDHIFFFFFCRNSSFCCVQERFKLKQSVLFWRTKTRSLAYGIPPALQSTPAFFCVCVHVVWLGFFQRSKNRINQNQNQPFQTDPVFCTGSFPVRPVIGGLKSGAVVNQTKPNTSGCELEKTCDFCLAKRFVSGDTSGVLFSCLCDSEHAEWDRVGEHRQPHWSWWQIVLLWPSVVSFSLSFF